MSVLLPALQGVGAMDNLLSKPVSFSTYMDLFTENYTDLLALLGGSFKPAKIGGAHSYIAFTPLRKNKYTMAMRMTYKVLKNNGDVAVEPLDAIIYIYNDTWQAELIKVCGVLREQLKAYESMGIVVRRWLLNALLHRILKSVAEQVTATAERRETN